MNSDVNRKFLGFIKLEHDKISEHIKLLERALEEEKPLKFNHLKWLMGALWGINKSLARRESHVK